MKGQAWASGVDGVGEVLRLRSRQSDFRLWESPFLVGVIRRDARTATHADQHGTGWFKLSKLDFAGRGHFDRWACVD